MNRRMAVAAVVLGIVMGCMMGAWGMLGSAAARSVSGRHGVCMCYGELGSQQHQVVWQHMPDDNDGHSDVPRFFWRPV